MDIDGLSLLVPVPGRAECVFFVRNVGMTSRVREVIEGREEV